MGNSYTFANPRIPGFGLIDQSSPQAKNLEVIGFVDEDEFKVGLVRIGSKITILIEFGRISMHGVYLVAVCSK